MENHVLITKDCSLSEMISVFMVDALSICSLNIFMWGDYVLRTN